MTDKLEALSQPVAWSWTGFPNKKQLTRCEPEGWKRPRNLEPLYSQEYVTVLCEDAVRWFKAFEKAVSTGARYEERIEALQQQAVKDGNRITELEQRLQQPIKLPELSGDGENDTDYTEGLNDGISQSAIYLRRQGYQVEGE